MGIAGDELAREVRENVYDVPLIGKVTESILKNVFWITTCEDMLQKSHFLCALFSPSSLDFFLSVALGLGGTNTPQTKFRKSISNERTFSDTNDEALIYKKLENGFSRGNIKEMMAMTHLKIMMSN